ncbi:MAG: hypothetical protein QOI41_1671 [Myxococcales bacterium]|nr:hypothetical protein [Myxococcales bacterium]
MKARHLLYVAMAMLSAGGASSCFDPVHSADVDALGPERTGVRPGPNHRPGQNCLTCHGGNGPASPDFSIAGTVYSAFGVLEPIADVTIVLEDANHETRSVSSNEVGNFYMTTTSWSPAFPVSVQLQDKRADDHGVKSMVTPIGRTGGCAFCHFGAVDEQTHMPPVYLRQKAL